MTAPRSTMSLGCASTLIGIATLTLMPGAAAQIIPDESLGAENSMVGVGAIEGLPATLIEGGATRESNLFHSFLEFNVGEGQRVYFASPLGIESILSRVTGANPSNIFGTLGVAGAADLFLVNPNGIVFGENATLDIPGSFYGTTADAIPLGDEGLFSATDPEQSTLLTVRPEVSFFNYLTAASGDIESRGALATGENLTLAGNRLELQGQVAAGADLSLLGREAVQIRDAADMPFIGFAGGDLLVQGNEQVDIVALSHPDSGLYSYGDMVLRSANPVGGDAHYWSAGNFRVETLDGGVGDLYSPIDPIIRTFGDVVIDEYEGSSLHILAGGSVTLGTATITAPDAGDLDIDFLREDITLSDGTVVQVDGGAQPTLDVRAGVAPEALGAPPLELLTGFNNNTVDAFTGNAFVTGEPSSTDITVGDVLMNAADSLVLLTSNYEPNDNLEAGDITLIGEGNFGFGINARNFIGTGGTVFIDARGDINVINSSIRTTALTEIGDIVLLAEETVRFDGADGSRITGAFASIAAGSEYSSGGTVRINANNLEVLNGAQVASSVFGTGQGGDILFNITETASFVGSNAMNGTPSGAFSTIARGGEGQGGNIEITAHELDVLQGGQISASSFGIGATGSMVLTIAETARFVGSNVMDGTPSGAFSNIARGGEGQGGDVRVQASNIEIRDGANLSASISGVGEAGNILLTVQDTVQVLGSDSVVASQIGSNGQGQGGNVEITARELEVLQGGQIGASLFGIGAAGNVVLTIDETARFVGVDPIDGSPSGVFSSLESAGEGSGGKVEIRARNLDVFDGAILSASNSGTGEAGSIVVEVEDIVRFVGIDLSTSSGRPSGAISAIGSNGLGTGGNVEVTAANLEVLDGAQLIASTLGIGQAGTIVLDISETARFSGVNSIVGVPSGAFSQIEPSGAGISGDILVHARALEVLDGAQLSTSVFGSGSAGNVILNVLETARFIGSDPIDDIASGAFSRVNSGGEGKGGNVIARAANLEVLEGAQISASTFGIGPAGSVILEVTETARFIGFDPIDGSPSGAFSTIDLGAEGRGGNVEVQASNLDILRGAVLSSRSFGTGNAGDIDLLIADQLLVNDGIIGTDSNNSSGGQINIQAGNIILRNDSDIQTFVANGEGGGGNITIAADFVIALEDSDILAFSADGFGGNIDLSQTTLFSENLNFASGNLSRAELEALDGNNRVDINATGGIASGQVSINDASFVENSLNELSGDLVDTAALTAGSCIARSDDTEGSFVVTGGEGLPQRPGGDTIAVYPTGTVQTVPETASTDTLQEPESVYRLADGRLVLSHDCATPPSGAAF